MGWSRPYHHGLVNKHGLPLKWSTGIRLPAGCCALNNIRGSSSWWTPDFNISWCGMRFNGPQEHMCCNICAEVMCAKALPVWQALPTWNRLTAKYTRAIWQGNSWTMEMYVQVVKMMKRGGRIEMGLNTVYRQCTILLKHHSLRVYSLYGLLRWLTSRIPAAFPGVLPSLCKPPMRQMLSNHMRAFGIF